MQNNDTQIRLYNLLNEHKITQDEYNSLIQALYRKTKPIVKLFKFLINPFEQLSPKVSLIIGIFIIFALGYIGYLTDLNFSGLFGAESTTGKSFHYLSIIKNLSITWLYLSFIFMFISKILGGRYLRVLDFLSFCALAKFPFFIAMFLDSLSFHINPRLVNFGDKTEHNIFINIYTATLDTVVVFLIFWHIILYFNAFKQASGLNHNRTWFGFIVAMVTSHAILTFWLNTSHS